MLATPVTSMNTAPPTSGSRLKRSKAWSTSRAGGHVNRRGKTDQSLANSSGTAAIPVATWTPCVTRYRPAGRDGHSNHDGGCWMRWDSKPVRKQTEKHTPSAMPSTAATRSPWRASASRSSRHPETREATLAAGAGSLTPLAGRR